MESKGAGRGQAAVKGSKAAAVGDIWLDDGQLESVHGVITGVIMVTSQLCSPCAPPGPGRVLGPEWDSDL